MTSLHRRLCPVSDESCTLRISGASCVSFKAAAHPAHYFHKIDELWFIRKFLVHR